MTDDLVARREGQVDRKPQRSAALWVAIVFFLVWALSTHTHADSYNDQSRMSAVESLVERGTWIIDESAFARTGDRILVDGHFYSDKPPVLTLLAAGVYGVLHNSFQLDLDARWCDADVGPCHCRVFCDASPDLAYYLLTLILVGLPSAVMLGLFYRMICGMELGDAPALLLTIALGIGTQVFPYSTVFNSHLPAAAALFGGFYALLKSLEGRRVSLWLCLAGILIALAATFDLGVGLFLVGLGGWALWKYRFAAWPFLLGALLPLVLMVTLDFQIVGNPLPPYMFTAGYDYPGSRFPQTLAGNRSPDNVVIYGFRLLLGDRGLFSFTPVMLWAVIALSRVVLGQSISGLFRSGKELSILAAIVGVCTALFVLYFVFFTDNFGGAAYGPRWYTVFLPLLFFYIAVAWRRMARQGGWAVFAVLLGVSLANSYQGALNPWRVATPLFQLETASLSWRSPVHVALSGVAYEELPPDLLEGLAARRVDKRWFDARQAVVIPPYPTWIFVSADTPLDPALARWIGLDGSGELLAYRDFGPARDVGIEQLETLGWTSPVLAPRNGDSLTAISYPVAFGEDLVLLGYEWPFSVLRPGQEVNLVTVWRIEQKPAPPLTIFVHLLDESGGITGQVDDLGANPDGLYPRDVLVHVHRFSVSPDATTGQFWLQIGMYNPETLERLPVAGQTSGQYGRLLLTRVDIVD